MIIQDVIDLCRKINVDRYKGSYIAFSDKDLQSIGGFRYKHYIELHNKPYALSMNHLFLDGMDSISVNFYSK
jgi:hypothetical protein